MTRKRNLLSVVIVALLTVALLSSIALFFISQARASRLQAEITSKYDIINQYAQKTKMPISKESVQLLMDKRNKLKSVYTRFKMAFTSPLNEEISDQDLDPLQFKERLIQIQKKLREDANSRNLLLPESLGFAKYEAELSEPSEILHLIRRLKVLEELIYTMVLAGIESLDEIGFPDNDVKKIDKDAKPKKVRTKRRRVKNLPDFSVGIEKELKGLMERPVDANGKRKEDAGIYFDIPASFTMHCTNSKLIDFLYRLRLSSFAFVVEDLDIEKIEDARDEDARDEDARDEDKTIEGELKVSLLIKAITLN